MRLTAGAANRQPARVDSTLRLPPEVPGEESPVTRPSRHAWRWWLALAALPVLALLYWFDPAQHGFYPRCHFRALTGLDCPGCGGLRATHALLHGDLAAAWRFNALFLLALPAGLVALTGGAPAWLRALAERWWPSALLVVVAAFTVFRNL
jgi:hypothetical protein